MSKLFLAPILWQYNFLNNLSNEAAAILSLDLSDENRNKQFKITIFINFNNYLVDSLLFLPEGEAEALLAELTPCMEVADEQNTLNILNSKLEFFDELRSDFLNIIKTLKK